MVFFDEDGLDDAHAHIKRVKPHALDDVYTWVVQSFCRLRLGINKISSRRLSGATEIFEKLGAANMLEACRDLLRKIEQPLKRKERATFKRSDPNGERRVSGNNDVSGTR